MEHKLKGQFENFHETDSLEDTTGIHKEIYAPNSLYLLKKLNFKVKNLAIRKLQDQTVLGSSSEHLRKK